MCELLILGIDAMDYKIMKKIDDKHIPVLRKLEDAEGYSHGKLESFVTEDHHVPHTGPCFFTAYSGKSPEEHGITSGGWIQGEQDFTKLNTVFDKLYDENISSAFYQMPVTYPPKDFGSWTVSGFPAPTSDIKKIVRPKELAEKLPEDYIKSTNSYLLQNDKKTALNLLQAEEVRLDAFLDLDISDADVVAYGVEIVDETGHVSGITSHNTAGRRAYAIADKIVEKVIEKTSPDNILVFSDHGMAGRQHRKCGYYLYSGGDINETKTLYDIAPTILNLFEEPHNLEGEGIV